MKTILPERSLVIKPLFDQVTFKILTVRKDTMLYALYRFGYHSKATVHGFIATALTIVNERDFKYDVIERQLAHVERNKIRASYNHAQYQKRKEK